VRSDIAIFIENHRGLDPSNLDQLCSQSATDALVSFYHFLIFYQNKYGEVIVRCHGEGFNWREADIDPMAVYASGGGKSHGQ
jgi:hypothetical protein